jgi:hypothetical protein
VGEAFYFMHAHWKALYLPAIRKEDHDNDGEEKEEKEKR